MIGSWSGRGRVVVVVVVVVVVKVKLIRFSSRKALLFHIAIIAIPRLL